MIPGFTVEKNFMMIQHEAELEFTRGVLMLVFGPSTKGK